MDLCNVIWIWRKNLNIVKTFIFRNLFFRTIPDDWTGENFARFVCRGSRQSVLLVGWMETGRIIINFPPIKGWLWRIQFGPAACHSPYDTPLIGRINLDNAV